MKILHLTRGSFGGLDFASKDLFSYLAPNHSQKIFYFDRNGSVLYENFSSACVGSVVLKGEIIFVNFLNRLKDFFEADFIHIHHTKVWVLFSPLCFFSSKNIFSFHMSFGSGLEKNIFELWITRLIVSYCTFFSKTIIFLTLGQKNEIKKHSFFKKIFDQKALIIPNSIDDSIILCKKNNFSRNILFVGRYTKIKGYEDLLSLAKETKSFNFYTIGEAEGSELDNLTNIGEVNHEKIIQYYDRNTILILPSYTEAFPLVILEAMARGLVVLVSDIPGMRNIIKEGRNGFLFPAGSVHKMSDVLLTLRDNLGLIEEISKNNLNDVKKYSKKVILPLYEHIYE